MRRTLPLFFLFLLLPIALSAQTNTSASAPSSMQSTHGQKLRITGIPNAGKITEVLYRGAQPREVGLSELKILGVATVVDLRQEDRETIAWERKHVESLGMRFVHIPVDGWSTPTDEQVVQFLSLLRDNPGKKIFVHCHFGDDRTSVFIAAYRMAIEKWTSEQAIQEMYFFGFNGFWHPSMKTFVRNFPAHLNTAPPLASFPTATSQP
jgi:protein tyrosine/serine phosphatase